MSKSSDDPTSNPPNPGEIDDATASQLGWEEVKQPDILADDEHSGAAAFQSSSHIPQSNPPLDAADLIAELVRCLSEVKSKKHQSTSMDKVGESREPSFGEDFRERLFALIDGAGEQFKQEGIEDYSSEFSELKEISECLKRFQFDEASRFADSLLRRIKPFDIKGFLHLYKQNQGFSDELKGKYCWFLIGLTGAGKSTSIHYLADSKMVKQPDSEHITYSEITNLVLNGMKDVIKPGEQLACSETRSVAGVPLDLSDFQGLDMEEGSVFIADSPGICDSRGSETDLANSLGMVRSLKKARRVKLLIVVSKMHFEVKMEAVKMLTSFLQKLMPKNYNDVLKKHSMVFFTKAPDGFTEEQIRKDFQSVASKDSDNQSESFKRFAYYLGNGSLPAECVFPLNPDAQNALIQRVNSEVEWIDSPQYTFSEFGVPKSLSALTLQLSKYQNSIRRLCDVGLNVERCAMISKYLILMRQISKVLPNHRTLSTTFQTCESMAKRAWNAAISSAKEAMDNHDKVTVEGFVASLDEFTEKCSRLNGAELAGLMDEVNPLNTVDLYINGCVEKLINHLTKSKSDDPWQDTAAKLRVLVDRYSATNQFIQEKITAALQSWNSRIKEAEKAAQKCIEDGRWDDLLIQTIQINHLFEISAAVRGNSQLAEQRGSSSDICRNLKNNLYQRVCEACNAIGLTVNGQIEDSQAIELDRGVSLPIFDFGGFDEKAALAKLKDCDEMLESCVDTFQRCSLISPEYGRAAQNIQQLFWNELIRFCVDELIQPATNDLHSDNESWERCQDLIHRCELIRSITTKIRTETNHRFQSLRNDFHLKVQSMLKESEQLMAASLRSDRGFGNNDGSTQIDLLKLAECISNLSRAGMTEIDFRMRRLSKTMLDFVESLKQRAIRLQLRVERVDHLKDTAQVMHQLSQLSYGLDGNLITVKQKCDELFQSLQSSLISCLTRIANEFELKGSGKTQRLNLHSSMHSLFFLERARSINLRMDVSGEIASALESAEENLRQYLFQYGECWNNRFKRELQACIQLSDDCKSTEDRSGDSISNEPGSECKKDCKATLVVHSAELNDSLRELRDICQKKIRGKEEETQGRLCLAVFDKTERDMVGSIYERLCTVHRSLKNAILPGVSAVKLRISQICFELSILDDSFIPYAVRVTGSPEKKFNNIHSMVQSETGREISDLKSGVIRSFNEGLLMQLEDELSKLQELSEAGHQRVYNIVCSSVTHKLSEQYTDASGLALQVSEMMSDLEMHQLNEQLRKLESLARVVRPHLSDSMKQTIEEKASQLKFIFAAQMKDLVLSVFTAAAKSSFSVAERRLGMAIKLNQYLQGAVEVMLDVDTRMELTQKLKDAQKAPDRAFEALVPYFEKLDLSHDCGVSFTSLNTCHVIEQMQMASKKHHKYRQWLDRIEDSIRSCFLKACARVNNEEKNDCDDRCSLLTYPEKTRLLSTLRRNLMALPEKLSNELKSDLDEVTKVFDKQTKLLHDYIQRECKKQSWSLIAREMNSIVSSDSTFKNEIFARLKETMSDFCSQIVNGLRDSSALDRDSSQEFKSVLLRMKEFKIALLNPKKEDFRDKSPMKYQLEDTMDGLTAAVSTQCTLAKQMIQTLSINNISELDRILGFLAGMFVSFNTAEWSAVILTDSQNQTMTKELDSLRKEINARIDCLIKLQSQARLESNMHWFGHFLNELWLLQKKSTVLSSIQELSELDVSDLSYDHTVCEVTKLLSDRRDMIAEMGLDNEKTRENEARRRAHFAAIQVGFQWFVSVKVWADKHLSIQPESDLIQPCLLKIRKDSKNLCSQAKSVMDSPQLCHDNLNKFNTSLEILKCCAEFIPGDLFDNQKQIVECRKKIKNRIGKAGRSASVIQNDLDLVASKLIELQNIVSFVKDAQDVAKQAIKAAIKNIREHKLTRIHALTPVLRNKDAEVAAALMREEPAFKLSLMLMQREKIISKDIKQVTRGMKSWKATFDLIRIKRCYQSAKEKYEEAIQYFLAVEEFSQIDFDGLMDRIRDIQQRVHLNGSKKNKFFQLWKKDSSQMSEYWTQEMIENIPELVGLIFAVWTLKNSQAFFESESSRNNTDPRSEQACLLRPHVSQFVSIFCLLCLDQNPENQPKKRLINNLVEIGTGEGKSVTMAVTAAVLALLGFDVSCGCYSSFLSERDSKEFADIFEILGVSKYIHYGTFNQLLERNLNKHMDLRQKLVCMLTDKDLFEDEVKRDGDSGDDVTEVEQRPSILIVDEADVLFDKGFFGALYSVSTIHKNAVFADLIRWVWERKKSSDESKPFVWNEDEFLRSAAFDAVTKEFVTEWHPLLEEAMKDIFHAAKTSDDYKSYVVCDGRIGHKFQDSVSYDTSQGYPTMIAYLKEYDEGRVTKDALDQNLGLFIKIASFSYAEVPQTFSAILGVTGTLQTLSEEQKMIMERDYGISKYVYMPSLFGERQLVFKKDRDVRFGYDLCFKLTESIQKARDQSPHVKRPALIIFEDEQHLRDFENSTHFSNFLTRIGDKFKLILTEELSDWEKTARIKQAGSPGMVTLATASFGRGIDFQVYNDTIDANGGMHVENAFFPESRSEEIQNRGRTSRHGRKGSFGMTCDTQSLEKFGISLQMLEDVQKHGFTVGSDDHTQRTQVYENTYEFVSHMRDLRFVKAYEELVSVVKNMRPVHQKSEEFVDAMVQSDWAKAVEMLKERNKGAFLGQSSAMCILIDATYSMGPLLNQVKQVLQKVIPQIQSTLIDNGYSPKLFKMKIICYRNYNAPADQLVVASDYTSDDMDLISFLAPVQPHYGLGSEAVEVGLEHVANLGEVPEFALLIGDAPSNWSPEVISEKRARRGPEYWAEHPQFKEPTFWEDQVECLKQKGVRIHTFYLKERAKENFEEIASRTQGVSKMLNVEETDQSIKTLIGAIADQVLTAVDAGSKGLVEEYHRRHPEIPWFLG